MFEVRDMRPPDSSPPVTCSWHPRVCGQGRAGVEIQPFGKRGLLSDCTVDAKWNLRLMHTLRKPLTSLQESCPHPTPIHYMLSLGVFTRPGHVSRPSVGLAKNRLAVQNPSPILYVMRRAHVKSDFSWKVSEWRPLTCSQLISYLSFSSEIGKLWVDLTKIDVKLKKQVLIKKYALLSISIVHAIC